MFESGIYHWQDAPPAHLIIQLFFDRPMDQTVTPDPASIVFNTNLGPAVGYSFGWINATTLLIEANDIGGVPDWVTVQLVAEDRGLRSVEGVKCCPFGPADLVVD